MGVTISTHNGSVVHQAHNLRDKRCVDKEPHIDPNGVHEIWVHEGVREAYDRLFGESVKRYNERQTRPERRIKSYYNKVLRNEKMHTCYEMIIGVYGRNDDGTPICSDEMGKEIMMEFVDDWKRRNPNLELIGAYYHADEAGEPHVHIDYIPVAHGYKKGMDTQAGLVKAFGEQGLEIKGNVTAQIQWENRENDYLTKLCERRGLTVDHPKEQGVKHLETEIFKKQKELDTIIDNCNDLTAINRGIAEDTNYYVQQRDKANKDAQRALNRKIRGFKLKRDKHGKGYTYDKRFVDEIKSIGKEIKQDVETIKTCTDTNAEILYNKAYDHEIQCRIELDKAKKDRIEYADEQERLIEEKANSIVAEFIAQVFNDDAEKSEREQRLEEFCKNIKYKDGSTVYDRFVAHEKKLQKHIERSFEEYQTKGLSI